MCTVGNLKKRNECVDYKCFSLKDLFLNHQQRIELEKCTQSFNCKFDFLV